MKNLWTAFVVILCLEGFSRLPIAGAADMCIAADDFGYLDIDYVDQYTPGPNDQSLWCWVASANAVTNHFSLIDPATNPASLNRLYTKCRLYNIAKNPGVDCCTTVDPRCGDSGMPWEVFLKLNPEILYQGEANWMEWSEIKGQICPGGNPGHPFIFIAKPHIGFPHTHVVKGFSLNEEGFRQLLVDDHYGNGAQMIDYECKYKLPAGCQQPNSQWDRVGDLFDLQPSLPDNQPPPPPSNLSVK